MTGVGFIGGGAILQRDDIVVGVTTAATLWFANVVGLCLGGGQLGLGGAATLLGLFALWGLRWAEDRMRRARSAKFGLELDFGGPSEDDVRRKIAEAGFAIASSSVSLAAARERRALSFTLRYAPRPGDSRMPPRLAALAREPGVVKVDWRGPL